MRMHRSIGWGTECARGVFDNDEWQSDVHLLWQDKGAHACVYAVADEEHSGPLDCLNVTRDYNGPWEPELADLARALSVVGVRALDRHLPAFAWGTASDCDVCHECNTQALARWGHRHPLWGRVFTLATWSLETTLDREREQVIQRAIRNHYTLGVYAQLGVLPPMSEHACYYCGELLFVGRPCLDGSEHGARCRVARMWAL